MLGTGAVRNRTYRRGRTVSFASLSSIKCLANEPFGYENEIWYTLKIEKDDNRYLFWIGEFGLEIFEDSVPKGWIHLHFVGRFNLWLDDFTVTGSDVPDGGPGFP